MLQNNICFLGKVCEFLVEKWHMPLEAVSEHSEHTVAIASEAGPKSVKTANPGIMVILPLCIIVL